MLAGAEAEIEQTVGECGRFPEPIGEAHPAAAEGKGEGFRLGPNPRLMLQGLAGRGEGAEGGHALSPST